MLLIYLFNFYVLIILSYSDMNDSLIMSRYYTLTDLVPAYFVAIALNPEMKYKYFENEWEDRADWIENAKDMVQRVWKAEYQQERVHHYLETRIPLAPPINTHKIFSNHSDDFGELGTIPNWKKKKRQKLIGEERDELDRYLDRETEDDLLAGPLQYWIDHVNDIRQSNLARMALDIFTIPAMSADPERLFSR